ncbi:hypothetical protein QAD02_016709 [Eretmocerus hayati]|uniref:Uncharacterized protein n=1 Tax=Eretmocerus hayati TaxID=131215 RepID=A0ACC2PEN9_9HYME|nr:hypothetical protein QAD02_016709 [Eretmocerus hayati]
MKVKRGPTDEKYIKALGIFLLIWLAVALYAHVSSPAFDSGSKGVNYNSRFSDGFGYYSRDKRSTSDEVAAKAMSKIHVPFIFIALSAVISLLYVYVIRYHAKLVIFTVIFLICLLLLIGLIASTFIYQGGKQEAAAITTALACGTLLFIIVLAVVLLRRKIIIAAEVVREACKVVLFFPQLFILPIIQFVASIFAVGPVVYVYGCIWSKAVIEGRSMEFYLLTFLNSVGFYWSIFFIRAFIQMTLSGSYATWFWTLNKRFVPQGTVSHTVKTVVRYHTGTLAYGSLILTIFQMIREFFNSVKHRCGPCVACCCQWYFDVLEQFLNYLNRNAYVMTAVHGTDFVQSAKDAFNLLMRNIVGVAVTTKVTRFVIFIGMMLVLNISFFGSLAQFDNMDEIAVSFSLVALFGSALVADAVFFLVDVATDTIFLCVLEDYERNDGSEARPYYTSSELRTLFLK